MNERSVKPLGIKAYGHIPHLPGSRTGPADHTVNAGMLRMCTEVIKGRKLRVYVQEKLDGSCVSVAKIDGRIFPLVRAGYPAMSSPFEMHHKFHHWVGQNAYRFEALLEEGERVVGEWLIQAHGTRYNLPHEPFVAFDIMRGHERLITHTFMHRVAQLGEPFMTPQLIAKLFPTPIDDAMERLHENGFHGAIDEAEGAVWRVEEGNRVLLVAKYVRPTKVDGKYLPDITGSGPAWNEWPGMEAI